MMRVEQREGHGAGGTEGGSWCVQKSHTRGCWCMGGISPGDLDRSLHLSRPGKTEPARGEAPLGVVEGSKALSTRTQEGGCIPTGGLCPSGASTPTGFHCKPCGSAGLPCLGPSKEASMLPR